MSTRSLEKQVRILVVARDVAVRAALARILTGAGYKVELAEGPKRAREVVTGVTLAVVSIEGLGKAGLELARELSETTGGLVVVLEHQQEIDHLTHSPLKADAYIRKPLNEQNVLERIRGLLKQGSRDDRPTERQQPEVLSFAGWTVDLPGHSVVDCRGHELLLTPAEFALLTALARNAGRVCSRDQLREAVLGRSAEPYDRSIDVLVGRLRRKIEPNPKVPQIIVTVAGSGYKFAVKPLTVATNLGAHAAPKTLEVKEAIARPSSDKPSIAVLPFSNLSGDPEQDYFADGMVEEITTALSRIRQLFVIARNSSFTYKGRVVDVKQVGRELGVSYLLEGSVRKAANRVRVTAQLVDAVTGHHLWAERYDRELADIFAVQDEITERAVAAIEPQLYSAEGIRTRRKPPESLDAWECVVRALSFISARTRSDYAAARELLQKAIALDPGYAQAQSLLACVIATDVVFGWASREKSLTVASDAAHKALLLDANDPWAHLALGFVLVWSRRAGDAVREYETALHLNPNFAFAHTLLGLALCYLGKSEEALIHADQAARLNPRDLLVRGFGGADYSLRAVALFVAGRYREAVEFSRKAIIEFPGAPSAYRHLVINHALGGEIEQAKAALQILKRLQPDISLTWARESLPFVRDEDRQRYVEGLRLAGLE
jgi:TolB-like protein/DNA-binding response OmpR family regulator